MPEEDEVIPVLSNPQICFLLPPFSILHYAFSILHFIDQGAI